MCVQHAIYTVSFMGAIVGNIASSSVVSSHCIAQALTWVTITFNSKNSVSFSEARSRQLTTHHDLVSHHLVEDYPSGDSQRVQ